ncbi:hypothetical protein JCM10003_3776 [Bacteroides pyogenes JCM 10003]|nr:hypothetical protein JCM10003_3776 [Bacteroides pyogenes JCM 10003]
MILTVLDFLSRFCLVLSENILCPDWLNTSLTAEAVKSNVKLLINTDEIPLKGYRY